MGLVDETYLAASAGRHVVIAALCRRLTVPGPKKVERTASMKRVCKVAYLRRQTYKPLPSTVSSNELRSTMPGLTTTTPPPSHIVVQTIQAWGECSPISPSQMIRGSDLHYEGHARSVVTFCAQLTKLHPDVYITLLTSDGYFPRIKRELARSFDDHHEECAQRVRYGITCYRT